MWIKLLVWLGIYSKPDVKILQLIEEYKAIRKILQKDLDKYRNSSRGFCSCISVLCKDNSEIRRLSDAKHLVDAFHEYYPEEYNRYYKNSSTEIYWSPKNILGLKRRIFLLDKTIENLKKLC